MTDLDEQIEEAFWIAWDEHYNNMGVPNGPMASNMFKAGYLAGLKAAAEYGDGCVGGECD